jgi:hypothetical protein
MQQAWPELADKLPAARSRGRGMASLDEFPNAYCPTCKRVQPARFEVVKADAYIDHASMDIVAASAAR